MRINNEYKLREEVFDASGEPVGDTVYRLFSDFPVGKILLAGNKNKSVTVNHIDGSFSIYSLVKIPLSERKFK